MNRYDEDYAPTHSATCYYCAGDSPVDGADHADTHPCDAIGHQYGTASEDHICYGCGAQATDPAMIDPHWSEYQDRAYRAADFFTESRAARDDIAYGAYPNLGHERLTAPMFRDGEVIARVDVNIIGTWTRGAYIVQSVHGGPQWIAFPGEVQRL